MASNKASYTQLTDEQALYFFGVAVPAALRDLLPKHRKNAFGADDDGQSLHVAMLVGKAHERLARDCDDGNPVDNESIDREIEWLTLQSAQPSGKESTYITPVEMVLKKAFRRALRYKTIGSDKGGISGP